MGWGFGQKVKTVKAAVEKALYADPPAEHNPVYGAAPWRNDTPLMSESLLEPQRSRPRMAPRPRRDPDAGPTQDQKDAARLYAMGIRPGRRQRMREKD